ncbi:hypothetical protein KUCAC02_035822 [Chaenocephalus aceratus]|nr:hypothetical protein KUCAC02_035822 [Chaenocephalus aceratus]
MFLPRYRALMCGQFTRFSRSSSWSSSCSQIAAAPPRRRFFAGKSSVNTRRDRDTDNRLNYKLNFCLQCQG